MKYILFCNIAWMKDYDFSLNEETPKHGGKYVADTGDANEKFNFHVCEDGKMRGFVETKHRKGSDLKYKPMQIRIERLNPKYKKQEKIDDVTVVFCAYSDECKKTVIVGWYENATVYRNRPKYRNRCYNLECLVKDAYLVDENMRDFEVPRARNGSIGFGQANVWYAKEEQSSYFVESVFDYIEKYKKDLSSNLVRIPQEISEEYYESGIGKKVLINKYERNIMARNECLKFYGTKCAICGFNSETIYGAEFKNKIQVHHIVPISKICKDYKVNPSTDLIPVCPNCHMILHSKLVSGKYPTVDMLKTRFKKTY